MPRVLAIVPDRYRPTLTAAVDDDAGRIGWEGVLAVEGEPTGDGRMMAPNALRWENLPLPLRWARSDNGAHDGAVTVGRIVEVWRDGSRIHGRGDLDLRVPEARELAGLMDDDGDGPTISGVSVDLDDVDAEVRVAADVLEAFDAAYAGDDDDDAEREVDEDGRVLVWEFASDDELFVTDDARVRAATIVDIPAFIDARIGLTASVPGDDAGVDTLVAAASPARPPRSWFPAPGWSPTQEAAIVTDDRTGVSAVPVRVTDDGRIFGHLAPWQACHTGYETCVNPPSSAAGYRYFHVGAIVCDDGAEVPVGRITLDTLHAGRRLSAADTIAHYENTGLAVADVVAGEDAHGIWISGAVRGDLTDDQLRALRASPLSGDWRRIGGSLELVAALAVNSPGFPVPRALVASGEVVTLQTSGTTRPVGGSDPLTGDEVDILRQIAARETAARQARRDGADQARRRMMVASAAARIARR